MSSSFRSAKKDDDDVESLVGTTKYAGGAGLQKWDKAVLVDLGTGEQPWLKEVYMGELQTPTTDEEAKVGARRGARVDWTYGRKRFDVLRLLGVKFSRKF